MILIDSSVWVDNLSSRPTTKREQFKEYMTGGEVVTIWPIINEVLSHPNPKFLPVLREGLKALERIDRDWNAATTWEQLLDISAFARRVGISPLGVVDRMVLLCAKETNAMFWTLEKKAIRLAEKLGIRFVG